MATHDVLANLKEKVFPGKKRQPQESTRFELLSSTENFHTSSGRDLHKCDIVVSAVKPYIDHIGKLEARHMRDGERFPNANIRFLLTDEPNELMTFQMVMERAVWDYMIEGQGWIHIHRDRFGELDSLWHIKPEDIEIKLVNGQTMINMTFGSGHTQLIPFRNLIHLKRTRGQNDFFGESPTKALSEILSVIETTDKGIAHAIKNSAIIRWIVKYTVPMHDDDKKKQTDKIRKEFLSMESGGVAATDSKYDLQQIANDGKGMFIPDSDVQTRMTQRIHNYFGISDAIITGMYTEEEYQSWYDSMVAPIVKQLSEQFTRKLFTKRERGHGNKITFDIESLQYASTKTKLELVQLVDRGILGRNEHREILGLPANGDEETFLIRREYAEFGEHTTGYTDDNGNRTAFVRKGEGGHGKPKIIGTNRSDGDAQKGGEDSE